MTRFEIYEEVKRAFSQGEAQIELALGVHDIIRERLKGLGALKVERPDALREFLQQLLLSDVSFHQELADMLMLTVESNGYPFFWDIDGNRLRVSGVPRRVAYWMKKRKEFWFRTLCGYAHLPAFPAEWLHEKLDPAAVDYLPPHLVEELERGGELWSFGMPKELWGPLCYRAGYAVVRDGVPVYEYATIRA
jgi:hypothetical protein